ncbi:cytoskeletal protein RodZ [Mycobacterium sp. MAA66]|uniref:hypothetical protein n=1 Tax=Mycobacterium sp. MAA66 TaxID=3156297 RepID=UPI003512C007
MSNINDTQPGGIGKSYGQTVTADAPAAALTGTPVEQAWQAAQHADKLHKQHIAAVNELAERGALSPEGVVASLRSFADTPAARQVRATKDAVDDAADAARDARDSIIAGLHTTSDTASQLHAQRTWARTKATLDADNGAGVVAGARQLIKNARPEDVPVLAEELPSYLQQRAVPADWLPDAFGEVVPEFPAAAEAAAIATKQQSVVAHNTGKLLHQFTTGARSEVECVDPTQINAKPYR